jgi:hypothetical protein
LYSGEGSARAADQNFGSAEGYGLLKGEQQIGARRPANIGACAKTLKVDYLIGSLEDWPLATAPTAVLVHDLHNGHAGENGDGSPRYSLLLSVGDIRVIDGCGREVSLKASLAPTCRGAWPAWSARRGACGMNVLKGVNHEGRFHPAG